MPFLDRELLPSESGYERAPLPSELNNTVLAGRQIEQWCEEIRYEKKTLEIAEEISSCVHRVSDMERLVERSHAVKQELQNIAFHHAPAMMSGTLTLPIAPTNATVTIAKAVFSIWRSTRTIFQLQRDEQEDDPDLQVHTDVLSNRLLCIYKRLPILIADLENAATKAQSFSLIPRMENYNIPLSSIDGKYVVNRNIFANRHQIPDYVFA